MSVDSFNRKEECPQCNGTGYVDKVNGATLRNRRETAGINLSAMALRCAVSSAYLHDIETNKRNGNAKIIQMYRDL